jgi:uroporphyrinogen decarboxylase
MEGYEVIRRNIEFDKPDRVGLRFNSLGVSDVFRIYVQPLRALRPKNMMGLGMHKKIRTHPGQVDSWGCRWDKIGDISDGEMGLVLDPPLKDLGSIETYPFPDPHNPELFDGLETALSRSDGKFVQLNSPFCLFERLHFLYGFDSAMRDLILDQSRMEKLLDKIIAYQIGIVEEAGRLGKGRIHCFDTTDDWGTQENLFISPRLWRKLFKPRYKTLIDTIHNNGMVIRFHSDGKINAIFDDLIELGVDILNIHQPRLLGIDAVAKKLAGKVCFEVTADIQSTLPTGDRDRIRSEVREIIDKWTSGNGGMIGIEYRYGGAAGIPEEAMKWVLEAFLEFGSFQ